MSRDVDEGNDKEDKKEAPEEELLKEQEHERSPQEKLGNSFLADQVRPLFGGIGVGRATRTDKTFPDDDEVVVVPSDAPDDPESWNDVLFGHPEWVPPARKHAAMQALTRWLPPPLPDPSLELPPAGCSPLATLPQPCVSPCLQVARHHADTWLRHAAAALATDAPQFAHLAGAGSRMLAGAEASRARVLAVRVAAATLGLARLSAGPAHAARLDLLALRPRLDARERGWLEDHSKVPFAARIGEETLEPHGSLDRAIFPASRHPSRGVIMTFLARLLVMRGGTVFLSDDDRASGTQDPSSAQGTAAEREALEDRATAVYSEILRMRVRMAAAAEALHATARTRFGDRLGAGLWATLAEVDRRTEEALTALRHLGQGLYAADPWPLDVCRVALRRAAEHTDVLTDQLLQSLSRWTALIIEPAGWPKDEPAQHTRGPWEDALELLTVAQQDLATDSLRLPPQVATWPWPRAALVLSRCDALAGRGRHAEAKRARDELVTELWTTGDPGAVAVVLAWRSPSQSADWPRSR